MTLDEATRCGLARLDRTKLGYRLISDGQTTLCLKNATFYKLDPDFEIPVEGWETTTHTTVCYAFREAKDRLFGPAQICQRCSESIHRNGQQVCDNCWEVERRLPKYIKSEGGRNFLNQLLGTLTHENRNRD